MQQRLLRILRAPVSIGAVGLFALNGGGLQGGDLGVLGESDFIRWALTQGGLVLVLIIMGWSYRRDLVRVAKEEEERTREAQAYQIHEREDMRVLLEQEQARSRALIELITNATVALTKMSDAVDGCPLRHTR